MDGDGLDVKHRKAQDTGRIQNKTIVSVESPDAWFELI